MIRATYSLNGTNVVLPRIVSFKREYLTHGMCCLSVKYEKDRDDMIVYENEFLAEEAETDLIIELNNYYKNLRRENEKNVSGM